MNRRVVFLNGQIIPAEQAMVSVTDRGFIFGDGVYEVIPFYSHIGFRLQEHVSRLMQSLAAVRIPSPYTEAQWIEHILAFNRQHTESDQSIYVQITRGPSPVRNHAFPAEVRPTVYMLSEVLQTPPAELVRDGVAAVTARDFRWLRCDIKSISLSANVLLRQYAVDQGVTESVLIRDGYLSEGAASNIFIVKNGMLFTPPADHLMLAGITYDVLLELAAEHNLPFEIRPISAAELFAADEIWLTSSTKEVLAITKLDNHPIGNGRPGPIFERMYALFQAFKRDVMRQGDKHA